MADDGLIVDMLREQHREMMTELRSIKADIAKHEEKDDLRFAELDDFKARALGVLILLVFLLAVAIPAVGVTIGVV